MSIISARRSLVLAAALAAGGMALMAPSPAQAWWRGGVFVGVAPFPLFVPPPVYYAPPPPAYYPPPAAYYAPGPGTAYAQGAPPGMTCYAGPYVCPMAHASPVGANCSCPTNTGRAPGQTH